MRAALPKRPGFEYWWFQVPPGRESPMVFKIELAEVCTRGNEKKKRKATKQIASGFGPEVCIRHRQFPGGSFGIFSGDPGSQSSSISY